jgi:hypothetical protein
MGFIIKITFVILLLNVPNSCNDKGARESSDCECGPVEENLSFSLDSSMKPNEYAIDVNQYINTLQNKKIRKLPGSCTKAQIIGCLLKKHPMIDSVRTTPSGRGVSFYNVRDGSWSNIITDQ